MDNKILFIYTDETAEKSFRQALSQFKQKIDIVSFNELSLYELDDYFVIYADEKTKDFLSEKTSTVVLGYNIDNNEVNLVENFRINIENLISISERLSIHDKSLAVNKNVRSELYKKGLVAKYTFDDIKGKSKTIKDAVKKAEKLGRTNNTILIYADTGNGKELFAQSMHNVSERRRGPFIAINCAALTESLLESELFGYEEGAFTGAKKGGKIGLFELADGGTVFLDEISEIPLALQGRLLRVLQERELFRIGSDRVRNVDIRVIAATNMKLYKLVKEGKFREDLFFRINVLNLFIAPLKERKEDILLLLDYFLKQMKSKISTANMDGKILKWLVDYPWPGNVREIQNFARRITVLYDDRDHLYEADLMDMFDRGSFAFENKNFSLNNSTSEILTNKIDSSMKNTELNHLREMLKIHDGNKTELAKKLGISRTTLWKRLKEIENEDATN